MIRRYNNHSNIRGFTFIGLLLVLLIIMILTGKQLGKDKDTGESIAEHTKSRAGKSACLANRNAFKTNIATWEIDHLGEKPTIEKMKIARIRMPRCPDGGTMDFGEGSKLVCSFHLPEETSP